MRPTWKTTLILAIDAAFAIGYLYAAPQRIGFSVGLATASAISVLSVLPGLARYLRVTGTISFFFAALHPTTYAAGLAVAGAVCTLYFFSGIALPADASFWRIAQAIYWSGTLMVMLFAFAIEIIKRLMRGERLSTYLVVAMFGMPLVWAIAGYFGPLPTGAIPIGGFHEDGAGFTGSDAIAIVLVSLAAAAGGAVYWLITVKLRAILTRLLTRVVCGRESETTSRAFS